MECHLLVNFWLWSLVYVCDKIGFLFSKQGKSRNETNFPSLLQRSKIEKDKKKKKKNKI